MSKSEGGKKYLYPSSFQCAQIQSSPIWMAYTTLSPNPIWGVDQINGPDQPALAYCVFGTFLTQSVFFSYFLHPPFLSLAPPALLFLFLSFAIYFFYLSCISFSFLLLFSIFFFLFVIYLFAFRMYFRANVTIKKKSRIYLLFSFIYSTFMFKKNQKY